MQTAFLWRQAHDGILALKADRTCVLDACRLHHRHVVVADPEHWAMDMCPERNVAVASPTSFDVIANFAYQSSALQLDEGHILGTHREVATVHSLVGRDDIQLLLQHVADSLCQLGRGSSDRLDKLNSMARQTGRILQSLQMPVQDILKDRPLKVSRRVHHHIRQFFYYLVLPLVNEATLQRAEFRQLQGQMEGKMTLRYPPLFAPRRFGPVQMLPDVSLQVNS